MNFTMARPCDSCPFRTDRPGFLHRSRAEEIAEALFDLDQTFACHKTVDYDDDGEWEDDRERGYTATHHCAGAMILMERAGRANQMMRIGERVGFYDRNKLDMRSPVFETREEFEEHHNA